MVENDVITVSTHGYNDIKDLTEKLRHLIEKHNWRNGIICVFAPGSTAGISTVEYEPGLKQDLPEFFEKLAPYDYPYKHHNTWHDDNGAAHVRSTFVGPSLSVPLIDGRLTLGTWQQIILLDFDTSARNRRIVVQFVGDER